MTESMIERVARAIDGDLWQAFDSYCRAKEWTSAEVAQEKMTRHVMQASFLRARAAIEAMREPTDAMIMAAEWAEPEYREDDRDMAIQFNAEWCAAIDAAINELVAA